MTRILVIEDEPDIRDLIRLNLELDGFSVSVAADGAAGLAAVKESAPDAIILDVMMPGIDGWEVLTRLKAAPDQAGVPVLMLTARASDMDKVRGGIEGAVRYLTKPFNPAELRNAVIDVLEGEPEVVQRRRAQQAALSNLARIEGGGSAPEPDRARPRLSRLDGAPVTRAKAAAPAVAPGRIQALSAKQRELIEAVAAAPTVSEAADRLAVSRSNVYASLRRIARKLGVPSVSDLVQLARQGDLS